MIITFGGECGEPDEPLEYIDLNEPGPTPDAYYLHTVELEPLGLPFGKGLQHAIEGTPDVVPQAGDSADVEDYG